MRRMIDMADHRKEQGRHHAMREHVGHGAVDTDDIRCSNPDQHIAHMRYRRITDHVFHVFLHQGNESGVSDIGHAKRCDQRRPELEAQRQHEQTDPDQAIAADFLQHSGVNHRYCRRSAGVTIRRPGVKRPHRQ